MLRFVVVIVGRVGPIFCWGMWFVLLGYEIAEEFRGLTMPGQRPGGQGSVGSSWARFGFGWCGRWDRALRDFGVQEWGWADAWAFCETDPIKAEELSLSVLASVETCR